MERLQKYISRAGIASRRKAEELIVSGKVRVNGHIVTNLGVKIDPQKDTVKVDGQVLVPEKLVYILLNKPKGVITSVEDPNDRPTVMEYLKDIRERIFPVGRLDYYTEGLLLLTNDGELAQRLMHPSYMVEKTYEVKIKGRILDNHLTEMSQGILIDNRKTAPAVIVDLGFSAKTNMTTVEISIHEGRNRQVRKMFEFYGYKIHNLKRISYKGLTLSGVKRGAWRNLTAAEVRQLKDLT